MKILLIMVTLLAAIVSKDSLAVDTYQFSKPQYEARFHALNKILRCPKCQNQNLADSNSMISQDLRKEVFRMMEEGRSDAQIVEFMVMRYGDFVLYKPKVDNVTYFLWYGPIGFGVFGFALLFIVVMRQRGKKSNQTVVKGSDELSAQEQQALDNILKNNK